MFTSSHILTFMTFVDFVNINKKRLRFGESIGSQPTEQGCLVHLTIGEFDQLQQEAPDSNLGSKARWYSEHEYLTKFKKTPPSGYVHEGLIAVVMVRACNKGPDIELRLNGERCTQDPTSRKGAKVSLELRKINWNGEKSTCIFLTSVDILD